MFNLSLIFPTKKQNKQENKKTVNALREVQAVNVHNIPHYIHVISECTPNDAVSNLCDRFRWTLVKGTLRGEHGLGLTQAASTRSPAGRKEPGSLRSCDVSSPPTLTAKLHTHELHAKLRCSAFAKRCTKTEGKGRKKKSERYKALCEVHSANLKDAYKHKKLHSNVRTDLVNKLNGIQGWNW